jgi:hypothetical protein
VRYTIAVGLVNQAKNRYGIIASRLETLSDKRSAGVWAFAGQVSQLG